MNRDLLKPHKVVALVETIIGFLFSCYASPQLYCVAKDLGDVDHCAIMAKLLAVCAAMFLIPGFIIYFHQRAGMVAQLLIPAGIIWILLQF